MAQIRAFVAIELDDALRAVLRQVERELKRSSVAQIARWVAPESVHLTLKFLGNVSVERVEQIGQAVRRGCESFAPFPVSLTELGCFPNTRRPRVIWVGVGGHVETLARLQDSVGSELHRIGFEPEKRGFTPHLTVARIRNRAGPQERQQMARLISMQPIDRSVSMTVREVSLIRSDLKPTGAVYTNLIAVPLTGA
jgi:2'-5' RNA ligase